MLNPLESADWDRQLEQLPDAAFFHTACWARVLTESYGYAPRYHVHTEPDGKLRSLIALMEVDSWLTGRRGVSLPFTDDTEPLCNSTEAFTQLFEAAKQLGRARRWKYIELRGGKKWLPEAQSATSFLNHILPLEAGEKAVYAACDDPVRRAIRKAEKNALTVEFSQSLPAMESFYQLMCLTRRRHGVPPQPFPFFAAIQRHVLAANRGWIVLASEGKTPVAGAIYFHFGRQAIYKYGASDETKQHLRANNLVMWRAIQRFIAEGFSSLDFGRTSVGNAGLRQFKRSWGTQEQTLDYIRFDLRQGKFVTHPDEATGWHNRVFQALPLGLSRMAGAILYRHIA
ncbi:MAG TPA: GNAT family N-acetyltransferase [Lacunisphaera sp.]|nr:GNAT family N-acetyltransferase [Lacunisphaera sp.]